MSNLVKPISSAPPNPPSTPYSSATLPTAATVGATIPRPLTLTKSANDDYGDLRLCPNSPAVDAGSNSDIPADIFDLDGDSDVDEPIPYDLAGQPRIIGGSVDMGAYETLPGDLDGDGYVGSSDLDIVRANWGEAVEAGDVLSGDASGDGIVGAGDLDLVRSQWGKGIPSAGAADAVFETAGNAGDDETDTAERKFSVNRSTPYGPIPRTEVTVEHGFRHSRLRLAAAAVDAWVRELAGRKEERGFED